MTRVLIIDDSPTVAKAIGAALRQEGHEVEALEQFGPLPDVLSRFRPEVIVLDLLMPGFNGIQFARFIQRYSENPPPIILHSGSDREMIRLAAREIKPFEVVCKGTSPRDLCRVVTRAAAEPRRAAIREATASTPLRRNA